MIKSNLENENLNEYVSNNLELQKWSDKAQEEAKKGHEEQKVSKCFREVPNIIERCFDRVKKDTQSDELVWQEEDEVEEIMDICDFEVFDMILESYKKKIQELQFECQQNLIKTVL